MTPEEHNKYVGIAHLAYGVFHILAMVVVGVVFAVMMGMMSANVGRNNGPPPGFFGVIMVLVVAVNVILAIPSFIAGYAFLKRKPWAKVAGMIAAVISALRVPFGTLVSVYTFWFLFSETGKSLYDRPSHALPPAPPANWNTVPNAQRPAERFTASSPPDWR